MIRQATNADIPGLMALRASVRENRLSDPGRITIADCEWYVAHGPIHLWEERGIITGFSACDPRDGSIWALFVAPAHEGRGIGQALIAAACHSVAIAGHAQAHLSTDADTRAARFYVRNGWVSQDTTANGEVLFSRRL